MAAPEHDKREQFSLVALPFMDDVYTAALYLTRNREAAEDLLQETFLRAYRFWEKFTPGTNCKAWLLTILQNLFRNRYRERQREAVTLEFDETLFDPDSVPDPSPERANPEERLFSVLLDGEVESALSQLPQDFLEVVLLIDVQELTYEEAAKVLDCPIGTVRSRLSRGRRLLHHLLLDYANARGVFRGKQ
jgi:RNA polymerase sigma-70 factor (ECF subfamily)